MRFLFVAVRYHTNQGPLVRGLLEQGHEVRFLVASVGTSEDHRDLVPERIPLSAGATGIVRRLAGPSASPLEAVPELGRLFRLMREARPDAVVIRDPNHLLTFVALLFARRLGARIALYTQGPKYRAHTPWRMRLVRDALLQLSRGVSITPVRGEPVRPDATDERIHVVPFAVRADPSPKTDWSRDGSARIVVVGKFEARKGHLLMVEVLARLRSRFSVSLTLIGECSTDAHRSYLASLRESIDRSGLASACAIRTNLPYEAVQQAYREHDVFVLPSRDEVAAVSHLEAMARGLPVICTDGNGTRGYIREGENGFIVRAGSVDELEARLALLLADPAMMRSFGRRGWEIASREHAPAEVVRSLVAALGGAKHAR